MTRDIKSFFFLIGLLITVQPALADTGDWSLCPDPAEAMDRVPNDLESLQKDIDRFTLCLTRAELVQKIEEVESKAYDVGAVDNAPAIGSGGPALLPLSIGTTAVPTTSSQAGSASMALPEEEYSIVDIRGLDGVLEARLLSPSGAFESVKEGDTLADGAKVTSVTASFVTVQKEGVVMRLNWNGGE